MTVKGRHLARTFPVEGVDDHSCLSHAGDGMVGRIIVGKPGRGPGTLAFDYFRGKPGTAGWLPVSALARNAFPSIQTVLVKTIVHHA